MSHQLQQSLSELQSSFDKPGGSRQEVSQRLAKLKLELAQTGLYFAPTDANPQDLVATRSILEIGVYHSLRQGNLKSYWQYNTSLQPFYDNPALSHLPPSPQRPITLGLHLLALLAEGRLTDFHTLLETLDMEQLSDSFVKLPVDLERWLMEGAYNKVYRARERVPREEFGFLLEKLMGQVRAQIAATIEASYPSLPLQNAASLLFYKPGEKTQLAEFAQTRGWTVEPTSSTIFFPNSPNPSIRQAARQLPSDASAAAIETAQAQGVAKGTPMVTLVGPALKLAQQLEAVV